MVTWDERKRKANLAKHGVDFALAEAFDWETALIEEDESETYGERRERAIGWIADALYVYVYTLRAEAEDTRSASAGPRSRRNADMSNKVDPLTAKELAEVERSRRRARRLALAQLETTSDEEEAQLIAAAEADPDNPPLTEEDWKRMRPAHEVAPHLVRKSLERKRGRPKLESPKRQVTLRLDADVVEHFRAHGPGWQTAMNDALRKAVGLKGSSR